jgi:hypothetical protein
LTVPLSFRIRPSVEAEAAELSDMREDRAVLYLPPSLTVAV